MSNEKIYTMSDLHVDYEQNMIWIEQLSNEKYLNNTIIIPGDITHVLSKLRQTLLLLKSKFKDVYYCPGNHELWTISQKEDQNLQIHNSIEKFHYIIKMCEDIGVHTKPGLTSTGVLIVPLFGWYDDSLHIPLPGFESDLQIWTDYHRCLWPENISQSEIAKYFVQLNEANLTNLIENKTHSKIITFSHFLTSKKLMDAYRNELAARRAKSQQPAQSPAFKANFSLVAGTELLGEQLKLIQPQIHIFGHSHRKMVLNMVMVFRYINNPLGYVSERESGLIEPPHELYEINFSES